MKFSKIIWIVVGMISFGLGTAGTVLPILPTVPLYLLTLFCFVNSSSRMHNWFVNTGLYKRYLLPYLQAGGLTKRVKIGLIAFVTLQIFIAALIVHKSFVGMVILAALYIGFLISMLFIVKTIPSKSESKEVNMDIE